MATTTMMLKILKGSERFLFLYIILSSFTAVNHTAARLLLSSIPISSVITHIYIQYWSHYCTTTYYYHYCYYYYVLCRRYAFVLLLFVVCTVRVRGTHAEAIKKRSPGTPPLWSIVATTPSSNYSSKYNSWRRLHESYNIRTACSSAGATRFRSDNLSGELCVTSIAHTRETRECLVFFFRSPFIPVLAAVLSHISHSPHLPLPPTHPATISHHLSFSRPLILSLYILPSLFLSTAHLTIPLAIPRVPCTNGI